jgi:putative photosynthetic complex assembly protein
VSTNSIGPAFPRGALLGAGALVTIAILAATTGRLTGIGASRTPDGTAVESRDLRFTDRSDGAVVITEAGSGRVVEVAQPGTNGFLRSTMRGLARDRKRRDIGEAAAFRLTRWADGRLSLEDEATGRRIDLGAFGPTNAGVFAHLMTGGSAIR